MVGAEAAGRPHDARQAMRAVASDREAAEMIGIDVDRVIALTFFIGSALAGVAGVMSGLVFSRIYNLMGFIAGLKAFTAAVVGGIGSIPGAMLGGLLHRPRRGLRHRLHLLDLHGPDRVRDPDRGDARAAQRACSAGRRCRRSEHVILDAQPRQPGRDRGRRVGRAAARPARDRAGLAGAAEAGSSGSAGGRGWRRGLVGLALPLLGLGGLPTQVGDQRGAARAARLGLNIVVGWAGLLDLGYIAFYGFGAYVFALLSSPSSGTTGRASCRSRS